MFGTPKAGRHPYILFFIHVFIYFFLLLFIYFLLFIYLFVIYFFIYLFIYLFIFLHLCKTKCILFFVPSFLITICILGELHLFTYIFKYIRNIHIYVFHLCFTICILGEMYIQFFLYDKTPKVHRGGGWTPPLRGGYYMTYWNFGYSLHLFMVYGPNQATSGLCGYVCVCE